MRPEDTNTPPPRKSSDKKSHFNLFRRFKHFNLDLSSPGVFACFFLSFCLVFCIFYLDYRTITSGLRLRGEAVVVTWLGFNGSDAGMGSAPEAEPGGGGEEEEGDLNEKVAFEAESEAEPGGGGEAEEGDLNEKVVFEAESEAEPGGGESEAEPGGGGEAEEGDLNEKVAFEAESGAEPGGGGEAEEGDLNEKVAFLEQGGEACNIFEGNWTWDETYPLYHSENCPLSDEGFRCSENGRPDHFYTKWRWQPKDCNLPRFISVLLFNV